MRSIRLDVGTTSMGRELEALIGDNTFIRIPDLLTATFYLKLEFFNPAGSIEFKTAVGLIRGCEAAGLIKKQTVLIESSTGRLGVALAMICAERGYRFKCVVDPNAGTQNVAIMRALGTEVICVMERSTDGEYLDPRLEYIRDLVSRDARYVWASWCGSKARCDIHAELTAPAIADRFPRVDYLFLDARTTGMLMGCANYFSLQRPETKIIAVERMGSTAFDGAATPAHIRGSEVFDQRSFFNRPTVYSTVFVPDVAAVSSCRYLARCYGILGGHSAGAVMTAVLWWRGQFHQGEVVVGIATDPGDEYIETIYNDEWVISKFGADSLRPELYTRLIEECVTNCDEQFERQGIAYA